MIIYCKALTSKGEAAVYTDTEAAQFNAWVANELSKRKRMFKAMLTFGVSGFATSWLSYGASAPGYLVSISLAVSGLRVSCCVSPMSTLGHIHGLGIAAIILTISGSIIAAIFASTKLSKYASIDEATCTSASCISYSENVRMFGFGALVDSIWSFLLSAMTASIVCRLPKPSYLLSEPMDEDAVTEGKSSSSGGGAWRAFNKLANAAIAIDTIDDSE